MIKLLKEVAELLVESPIEAIIEAVERDDEESGEVIIDKIAGSEAVYDNTAGAIVAVRDKIARGEAIRDKTAEEGEAILEAIEESKDPGSNPGRGIS